MAEVKFTDKEESDYLKKSHACPLCQSTDISAKSVNIDSNYANQDVTCEKCGAEWTDIYKMVGAELTLRPGKG